MNFHLNNKFKYFSKQCTYFTFFNLFMFYLLPLEMYPPVFVSKPDPMILYLSKQAEFQCSLTGSSPMDVVWHKDNIAISPGGNYVMKCEKNKYFLLIKSLELTDQGVYLCKASNSVGTATFTTELRVIKKPSFVKTFEPVSAAVNDPLRLECQVDEDTGVTITWTRDGKKVHQSMDCKLSFEDKLAVVEIPKSKLKDSGKYVCTAANEAGSSSCEAVVSVQGKLLLASPDGNMRLFFLKQFSANCKLILTLCSAVLLVFNISFLPVFLFCAFFSSDNLKKNLGVTENKTSFRAPCVCQENGT